MTPEQARALLAAPDLLAAADPDDLRVGERLRARWPADLVAAATEQVALRRRAAAKFDRADAMVFTRAGLEQASAEPVARHRAARLTAGAGRLLDLCCGLGGDLIALGSAVRGNGAGGAGEIGTGEIGTGEIGTGEIGAGAIGAGAIGADVIGVDRDETHALFARHNAAGHDVSAAVAVADVTDLRIDAAATVFVDPARRSTATGRDRRGGYAPPLAWCLALEADRVCVKAAPGLDRAVVPAGWEVEFVALGRDLKEAVLWSPALATAASRATVLAADADAHELVADPATPPAPVRPPGRFLLDPSPAVTRAAAVADLAADLGAWQVDPRIAFLSADRPLRSAFGRSFEIAASLPFGVKPLAGELRRLDVGAVDLRRRGLAGDVDDLRRRLRLRGTRRATVMLTRVVNRPWVFVCLDAEDA